jgi:hypothetical protein
MATRMQGVLGSSCAISSTTEKSPCTVHLLLRAYVIFSNVQAQSLAMLKSCMDLAG